MRSTLRDPVFRRLAAAYSVNELGNWLGDVALAVVVYDRTHSPLATAALFVVARFLPALAAPVVVARLEPTGGRRALAGVYLAEAAVFAALAGLVGASAVWVLLALAALDGALALSGRSLVRAATAARLPEPDRLRRANAVLNLGMTVGAAAGPAAAGVLVAGVGASGALALDAGSFALVAALLPAGLAFPGRTPDQARESWRTRLSAGAAYVRQQPALGRLLGAQALALVFLTAVLPVEVVFVKGTLGAGDAGYGALLASWGAGMVIGAALFTRAHARPLARLLATSTLAIGCAYGLMATAPTLAVACAASVLGGAGNGVQWVAFVTALQTATAPAMQARVMSLMEGVAAATPGLGFALGGVLAAVASPRAAFAIAAAGVAAAAVAFTLVTRRTAGAAPAPHAPAPA